MGISAPSLYNTYGDKHALYARALEHYLDQSARALIKRPEGSLPPKQAVRRFIEEIIRHSVNDPERRGLTRHLRWHLTIGRCVPLVPTASLRSKRFSTDQSKGRNPRGLSLAIARLKIWHGYCSAFCLAFGFSPAQSQKGPCSNKIF
jgi:AcrR family transcriptional regulator